MGISYTPDQALPKIKQFCAYQERCHSEVKEKLFSFGLNIAEVNSIISELINENYLNEERFAKLFAGGKFRIKNWGKNKIRQQLKSKQVSEYCIKKGLQEIDEEDYYRLFLKLFEQKLQSIKGEKNIFIKKRKIKDFLLQRGFENDLIHDALRKL